MGVSRAGAVALAFCLGTSAASSATIHDVTIASVAGEWVSVTPVDVFDYEQTDGENSSEIRWGDPFYSASDPQSGYRFDGAAPPQFTVDPDTEFNLGTFTHFNWPISSRPSSGSASITQAELQLTYGISVGDQAFTFAQTYVFEHDETPNYPSWPNTNPDTPCQYVGVTGEGVNVNGCADRVTVSMDEAISETLVHDGYAYSFDMSGFRVDGELFNFFLTQEEANSSAFLVGSYSVEDLTPVPLPAAGWMLLGGVGGLLAMKRRKAKAQA